MFEMILFMLCSGGKVVKFRYMYKVYIVLGYVLCKMEY